MTAMRPVCFRERTARRVARKLCFDVDGPYLYFTKQTPERTTHCFVGSSRRVHEVDDETLARALMGSLE